jgi:hypothetical protein
MAETHFTNATLRLPTAAKTVGDFLAALRPFKPDGRELAVDLGERTPGQLKTLLGTAAHQLGYSVRWSRDDAPDARTLHFLLGKGRHAFDYDPRPDKRYPLAPAIAIFEAERQRLGLSQAAFARQVLGLSPGHWYKLRHGTASFGKRDYGRSDSWEGRTSFRSSIERLQNVFDLPEDAFLPPLPARPDGGAAAA